MSQIRDKRLSDFVAVLDWLQRSEFRNTTVIGGIAVGAYVPEERQAALSSGGVGRGLSLHFYEHGSGRRSVEFVQRWDGVNGKYGVATKMLPELMARAAVTSSQGRRLLMRWLCRDDGARARVEKLLGLAPRDERADLDAMWNELGSKTNEDR